MNGFIDVIFGIQFLILMFILHPIDEKPNFQSIALKRPILKKIHRHFFHFEETFI